MKTSSSTPAFLVALGFVLVALTYTLLLFGSTVRVHGAGLACPDWPMCFGEWIPAIDFLVFLEFGHRVFAGGIGFLFLVWGVLLRIYRVSDAAIGWALAACVLFVQIVLGGLTVLELLAQWTVSSHLLTGNTFCALLLLLTLRLRETRKPALRESIPASLRWMSGGLWTLLAFQLVLGGFVAASEAGLACGAMWPACAGNLFFPSISGLFRLEAVHLQLAHRVMAYGLLGFGTLFLSAFVQKPHLKRPALLVMVLLWIQAIIGIVNVFFLLPVEITLLHSGGAAALFLSLAWLNWEVFLSPVFVESKELLDTSYSMRAL